MVDLIERQAAIKAVNNAFDRETLLTGFVRSIAVRAIRDMPPAQPKQRWIPCSERLPRQGQEVICQCRANMIKVLKLDAYGDWYQDAEHCYMGGFVIAWMPLPEPYKEGETT